MAWLSPGDNPPGTKPPKKIALKKNSRDESPVG